VTLNNALQRIAAIHQQHSIKCYLSTQYLTTKLGLSENELEKLAFLLDSEEPVFKNEILTSETLPFEPVIKRRHWVLSHGLYPYSYFSMAQWFQQSGLSRIFDYYLDTCTKNKEYLHHNISILLAFKEIYEQINTDSQQRRFIERFTEFVTATFYQKTPLTYPLQENYAPKSSVCPQEVLESSIAQPGFWGHNLIALSWLLKHKNNLENTQFSQLLLNLYEQCYWKFSDVEDSPVIDTLYQGELNTAALHKKSRALLFNNSNNLHQITLAASIIHLYKQDWITPQHKRRLISILIFFST
jgi:hypothetical protein